jgi:hypothetical protein
MVAAANLMEVAALVGDTARATMLNALKRDDFSSNHHPALAY